MTVNTPLSVEQRKAILQREIDSYIRNGYRVTAQTDTTAQLVRPKKFSCLIATLSLLIILIGFFIYLIYYLAQKDETIYIQVESNGRIVRNGVGALAGGLSPRAMLYIVVGGLLLTLCVCFSVTGAANMPHSTSTSNPKNTQDALGTATLRSPTVHPTITKKVTPTSKSTSTSAPSATPAIVNTQAPTFTLLDSTSPVKVSGDAHWSIQTTAGASCMLKYATPSGTRSEAAGLGEATADANGVCAWTWTIGPGTTPGTGRVTITVNGYTRSFDIVIE